MLDRTQVIDDNFLYKLENHIFPKAYSQTQLKDVNVSSDVALDMFDSAISARHLDLFARRLKNEGKCFYTIGSCGHEGNVVLGKMFPYTDIALLHYRSAAFFIQRLKQLPDSDPIQELLYSFTGSTQDPISKGRHKVFGSVPGNIPPQTSTIASHCPKAIGLALSIARAKELKIDSPLKEDSIVLCSIGDASFNHASARAAINNAAWVAYQGIPLPLIFVCEDNGVGISTPTPKGWIRKSMQSQAGITYIEADGLNVADLYLKAQQAEKEARMRKKPVFLHVHCVRLLGHAGSDIQQQYLTEAQIAKTESDDPLLHMARLLCDAGVADAKTLKEHYENTRRMIAARISAIGDPPRLDSRDAVMASIIPPKKSFPMPQSISKTMRETIFGDTIDQLTIPRNLSQHINFALIDLMAQYPEILVFGEDIAKKGGVYRVTKGLQERFGGRRVFDTVLDETTILGTAIGLAHNGFIPIPEIQFLAYYHNAEDQIRGEAATLSFFSDGQYTNPMLIRIAGYAYQKGFGGHFHNDNSIAALRDIPGVIVASPSEPAMAAPLLRRCVDLARREQRIVFFIEPIALYMTKDLHEKGDGAWLGIYPEPDEMAAYQEVQVDGTGCSLAIVSYANGYYHSLRAAKILQDVHGIQTRVIDLRWLAPLPEDSLCAAIKDCQKILIVDECRKTGSVSEALVTLLIERGFKAEQLSRLTAADSFITLGPSWEYLLPNTAEIIEYAKRLIQQPVSGK